MATIHIDIDELPSRFAEAVGWAERSDTVFVTKCGKAVFRLVPNRPEKEAAEPRKLGLHAGTTTLPPDFNDPAPDATFAADDGP